MSGSAQQGGFFAVDRRTWAKVSTLGLVPAVAYLVLARGTGRDNRTTAWSTQAIETYTGVSRIKAKEAIKVLELGGVTRPLATGAKPRYDLLPACEIPGTAAYPRQPLDKYEREAFNRVSNGERISKRDRDQVWLRGAVEKGWLRDDGGGWYSVVPEPDVTPDWIWLPNELVTCAAGETSPLELVRQTQDVMTLRLLVDFYHAQYLREDGGIGRAVTYGSHERFEVGRQGQFAVWGFRSDPTTTVCWNDVTRCHRRDALTEAEKAEGKNAGVDFFRRQQQLADLGLIEWVPHLYESDEASAEIIHPVGMRNTEGMEDRLGRAAHEAGLRLLTDPQREWVLARDLFVVPVPRHFERVAVISIARLRYRPHTTMTSAWWAELMTKGEKLIERYAALGGGSPQRQRTITVSIPSG